MEITTYAVFKQCSLVKTDGVQCGSPAVTGSNFCFHHMGGRVPRESSEPQRRNTPLKLLYPSDHAAIQHNVFLVMQAFSAGKIDNETALTYTRMLRFAELNLRRWQASQSPEGEEQKMPQEPAELSESKETAPINRKAAPSAQESSEAGAPDAPEAAQASADTEEQSQEEQNQEPSPEPSPEPSTEESPYEEPSPEPCLEDLPYEEPSPETLSKQYAESLEFLKARHSLLKTSSSPADQKEAAFLTEFFSRPPAPPPAHS